MSKVDDLSEQVHDREFFLAFVHALSADWNDEAAKELLNPRGPASPGANGWENGNIGAFLDAAARWAESTIRVQDTWSNEERRSTGVAEEASWRSFARFLVMGKYYE